MVPHGNDLDLGSSKVRDLDPIVDSSTVQLKDTPIQTDYWHLQTEELDERVQKGKLPTDCDKGVEESLKNRNEQVFELVKAVKFFRRKLADVYGECAHLRELLKQQRMEVSRPLTSLTEASREAPVFHHSQGSSNINSDREGQSGDAGVEDLTRQIAALSTQLAKKKKIQQYQSARISRLEEINRGFSEDLNWKRQRRVFTVDKGFFRQLTEDVRKLKSENTRLKTAEATPLFGCVNASQRADDDHDEPSQTAQAELNSVLRQQLEEAQRETTTARKQLLLTEASLKQSDEHNGLLIDRLRQMAGGTCLRQTPGDAELRLALQELDSARRTNAKLKIQNAELVASIETLKLHQASGLNRTPPSVPSTEDDNDDNDGDSPVACKDAKSNSCAKSTLELEDTIVKNESSLGSLHGREL